MPEDYHFALLSNMSRLTELVLNPFIHSQEVMNLVINMAKKRFTGKKCNSKNPQVKSVHSEAVEMISLCPFVYEFPTVTEQW